MLCIGARIKIHMFIFYIKRYKIPNKLEKLNVVYLCVFHSSVQTHKLSTLAPFEVGRFFFVEKCLVKEGGWTTDWLSEW